MDSVVYVTQIINVVFNSAELLSVLQEPFHFRLCSTVAKLEVVKHCVVLLCETLISVLYRLHIRAEFVGVVGHIHHSSVGDICSLLSVTAKR